MEALHNRYRLYRRRDGTYYWQDNESGAPRNRRVELIEGLEEFRDALFRDPDSGIGDLKMHGETSVWKSFGIHLESDGAFAGELHGNSEEIGQNLAQARFVAEWLIFGRVRRV